jgi:hypothetical protein
VFIDDSQWTKLWLSPERYYLVVTQSAMPRLEKLVGSGLLNVVISSGGKVLLCNRPASGRSQGS